MTGRRNVSRTQSFRKMLAHRVIPTLLCRGTLLIKGRQFDGWRSVGAVRQGMRIQAARGVDEVMLLDIDATKQGRTVDMALIESITDTLFAPLTVGGGISTVAQAREVIRRGADKVAVCTSAFDRPELVAEIADALGSQAVTVVIDVRQDYVYRHAVGLDTITSPASYASLLSYLGAGEIVVQSVDREGTLTGYDLDTIRAVSKAASCPVVALGGCGTYQHMVEALEAGADAVASGAMLQFTDRTPRGAADYLMQRGWEVR